MTHYTLMIIYSGRSAVWRWTGDIMITVVEDCRYCRLKSYCLSPLSLGTWSSVKLQEGKSRRFIEDDTGGGDCGVRIGNNIAYVREANFCFGRFDSTSGI